MAELEEYLSFRYKPPITLQIANEINQELVRNAEETILKEIVRLGVKVDRDELILALQYDRKQYEKGYADAMRYVSAADVVEVVRCKDCKLMSYDEHGYWCINDYQASLDPEKDYCSRAVRRADNG